MEKVLGYAISILIIGFGFWVLADGFSWRFPALAVGAIVLIAVGFVSLIGPT